MTRLVAVILLPFVVILNTGLVAVNAMVGAAVWLVEQVARVAPERWPTTALVMNAVSRLRGRAASGIKASLQLMSAAVNAVRGRPIDMQPGELLSGTLIAGLTRAIAWPAFALFDISSAVVSTSPPPAAVGGLGLLLSRMLLPWSLPGIIPGAVGEWTTAHTRKGFFVAFMTGANAVMLNFEGMCGGVLALLLGDPVWFASGLERHRGYAAYVYEKGVHGELEPGSGFPMSTRLVALADPIVNGYPEEFVRVLREDGWRPGLRAYLREPSAVHRMLISYWTFTARMMWDVAKYFGTGLLDAPAAQQVALCEMAIVTSGMPVDEKEAALFEVRKTAPNAIIEFEYDVSLLVPCDGTVADKVCRRTCGGEIIDTLSVVPSVCDKHAIRVAQSTNAEVYSLRAFLWLLRDEARAVAINARETTRKFGPDTAARIAADPLYPLTAAEINALTQGGPRPADAVQEILSDQLRARGLGAVADRIAACAA